MTVPFLMTDPALKYHPIPIHPSYVPFFPAPAYFSSDKAY